jgi:hypothetical protein
MDLEISPLGLRSICIEPGFFRTEILSENNKPSYAAKIADYKEIVEAHNSILVGQSGLFLHPKPRHRALLNMKLAQAHARSRPEIRGKVWRS